MRLEYINPFILSVVNVFNDVISNVEMDRGQLFKSNAYTCTHECSSVIGVSGEAEGRVILGMSKETAIKIANAMNDEIYQTFEDMVSSSINELTNMISGGAITIMNNNGMDLDISAPTVVTGDNIKFYDVDAVGEAIVVPIKTNFGDVFINVAMRG